MEQEDAPSLLELVITRCLGDTAKRRLGKSDQAVIRHLSIVQALKAIVTFGGSQMCSRQNELGGDGCVRPIGPRGRRKVTDNLVIRNEWLKSKTTCLDVTKMSSRQNFPKNTTHKSCVQNQLKVVYPYKLTVTNVPQTVQIPENPGTICNRRIGCES